jgi:glycosyltransferase involved in cell wall biosynthesis
MKISLCIPQYNRIEILLKNLSLIAEQTYPAIEVTISDDASTDSTRQEIEKLIPHYKYPILYYNQPVNIGFDANLRKSLELATGDYCLILGNDDSLNLPDGIEKLASFLEKNGRPEIGFCNYVEEDSPAVVIERASATRVIGSGEKVALKFYRSFSFVAGIIIRKDIFDAVNTAKMDGSIYVQIYFASRIIGAGGSFFMIAEPLVRKDLRIGETRTNSYRDTLIKKWKDLKPLDGGLPSMAGATIEGFKDAGLGNRNIIYTVFKNIYQYTYPYWLIDYRGNGALVAAVGMVQGLRPGSFKQWKELDFFRRCKIRLIYGSATLVGLLLPVSLFRKLKHSIYKMIKK